jgi:transcriptional repressor NrdR
MAQKIIRMNIGTDIRDVLPLVDAPTLILQVAQGIATVGDLRPFCGSKEHEVKDTRRDQNRIVRRRHCLMCERDFKTAEEVVEVNIRVRKSSGQVDPFDIEKVRKGIEHAAVRPDKLEDLDELLDRVLRACVGAAENRVITSRQVGSVVFDQLLRQDAVSAVRFALVLMGRTDRSASGWSDANDFRVWLLSVFPYIRGYRPPVDLALVVKRDGTTRENFDRDKLEASIGQAAKGRFEGERSIHRLAVDVADAVVGELGDQPLVATGQISAEILRVLRRRDHIAFLRFASTAKNYQTMEDYETEAVALRNLTRQGSPPDMQERRSRPEGPA